MTQLPIITVPPDGKIRLTPEGLRRWLEILREVQDAVLERHPELRDQMHFRSQGCMSGR